MKNLFYSTEINEDHLFLENQENIVEIHHKVENIDFDLMKLIGAHSAHAARSNFIDEEHDALIENNKNNIDLLIDTIADAFTSDDESN